jgi:hypothetical protein
VLSLLVRVEAALQFNLFRDAVVHALYFRQNDQERHECGERYAEIPSHCVAAWLKRITRTSPTAAAQRIPYEVMRALIASRVV